MPAPSFESLRKELRTLWRTTTLRPADAGAITKAAQRILKHKAAYVDVQNKTGVPWFLIAALHYRESANSFKKHLHEGSPLTGRTKWVPKGRPLVGEPPFTWLESALDALRMKGLHKIKDWSIERILYEAERYNGFGYRMNKRPLSPYLWRGTNHYTRGKYVRDHVYDPKHIDQQLGVVALIKKLDELDGSFDLEHATEPATQTVAKSKSLIAIIGGFIMTLGTQMTDAIQTSWDALGGLVAAVPALVTGTQEQVAPTEQLANWLGFDWSSIGKYLILATLILVAIRHFKDKQKLEQTEVADVVAS